MKKTVLITGASGGIGSECAKVFAQNGYNVALCCNKSVFEANELCNLICNNGFEAKVFCVDLSVGGAAKELVEAVVRWSGRIDVLVNNAGMALNKPFLETEEQEGKEIIEVDLLAAMQCAKYAANDMIKRQSGAIINVSSVWGICGASCEVYYSAAKAGLIGFTKALAQELAPSGIRVNAVAPGVIDTKMNANLSDSEKSNLLNEIPSGRFGNGYDVAKAVLFLASNDADYITGQTLNISGGFLI